MGELVGIAYRREKAGDILRPQSAQLVAGQGLEGDCHAGGARQLCLLGQNARRWMDRQTPRGLCFDRFCENLLVRAAPLDALQPGDRLQVGPALIEITERKPCFEECELAQAGAPCRLHQDGLFARVLKGGTVRVGDAVHLIGQQAL